MKTRFLFTTIALTATLYACNPKPSTSSQNDTTQIAKEPIDTAILNAPNVDDFATHAAIGGMTEVESSAIMIKRTENPDIQTLATMMVKDHGEANTELKAIARIEKLNLPQSLPAEKLEEIKKIEALQEVEQNRAYASFMVKEHQKAVALFSNASQNQSNPSLKAFAAKHLPTLKAHLSHAVSIQKKIQSIKKE